MTNIKGIPTGRFVWFEYVSRDAQRAQGFYGELFHWSTQRVPMPGGEYTMIALAQGEHRETIGGYLPTPPGAPDHGHWLAHLQVADAAASADAVVLHGGKIAKAPFKVGEMGTMAVVLDPLGGVFALWQPAQVMGTGDFRDVPGAWCWNELYTEDPARSVAFYAAIGGFTPSSMDMGPGGTYHLLEHEGKARAGVMKSPMPGIPQIWTPYIQVADTDATLARAKQLGADVKVPPNSAPGVGRFAIFVDPMGAAIGILQPAK